MTGLFAVHSAGVYHFNALQASRENCDVRLLTIYLISIDLLAIDSCPKPVNRRRPSMKEVLKSILNGSSVRAVVGPFPHEFVFTP